MMSLSYGSRKGNKIEWIVVHYPVAPGCNASWCKEYYERDNVSESAHYAVSQCETVSMVPCSFAAYHCATKGKGITTYCAANNYNSIGIDLMDNKLNKKTCSVKDCDWYIPEATLDRASYLIAYLMKQYNIDINHVVRHYDVTKKNCPRPLVGDDINEYYGIPGNERWTKFKQQIQEKTK
jgi:N-acetylmuramoyl-L-alanine amidase CwlA